MATPDPVPVLSRKVCIEINKNNFPVIDKELINVSDNDQFRNILTSSYSDFTENAMIRTEVFDVNQNSSFGVKLTDTITSVAEFVSVKWIKYIITDVIVDSAKNQPTRNFAIFDMKKSNTELKALNETNNKDKLFNCVLSDLQSKGNYILRPGHSQSSGVDAIKLLSNAVWFLDGRSEQFQQARADRGKTIPQIPERCL